MATVVIEALNHVGTGSSNDVAVLGEGFSNENHGRGIAVPLIPAIDRANLAPRCPSLPFPSGRRTPRAS